MTARSLNVAPPKDKILFIFSRFHANPQNPHHKCGTGIAQTEILNILKDMDFDVYFGGQEDSSYPNDYITESKAIIYVSSALSKFIHKKIKGKLILFAVNSHVLERNKRMHESAKKWNLPVESLSREDIFLESYEKSDYILVSGNKQCVQTFLDNGVPLKKIAHWRNCIYSNVYKPGPKKFPKFTFIHWASELGLRKGLPALLAAWEKWGNPSAELIIMGILTNVGKKLLYKRNWYGRQRPNYPKNIKLFASKTGYPSQDRFVIDTLGKCHVGIFPTLEDNQPAAAMEMACCELPLIITEEAGFELDSSWSYQVNRDDVDSLVQALESAYIDPIREQKGKNARQYMIKNHSWEGFRKNFSHFIKTTI